MGGCRFVFDDGQREAMARRPGRGRPKGGVSTIGRPELTDPGLGCDRTPERFTYPEKITRLDIRRHERLGGILHKYQYAA